MITQGYLDDELSLAKKLFLYYTGKAATYLIVGSDKYSSWYIDSLQLYILLGALKDIRIVDDVLLIGSEEINTDFAKLVFDKVREYVTMDVDLETTVIFGTASIDPIPTYSTPFIADWKELLVTITDDDITTVPLSIDISIMDYESMQLTVNGLPNPHKTSNTSKYGYHIIDSTLYWHEFYSLKSGDEIMIQYLQTKG